ncbi:MAG: hypothetical protein JRH06_05375 [Deltaproteobacteria bacterium]|nr:hypothetical protein [Deltaproteobacteria bacterium]
MSAGAKGPMISKDERDYVLENAYVPEHGLSLMAGLSGGTPFLLDKKFLCLENQGWVILVGYPLTGGFSQEALERVIESIRGNLRPSRLSIIAPQLPESLKESSEETGRDTYYILDIRGIKLKGSLSRILRKARAHLTVEVSHEITGEHRDLIGEFLEKAEPPERVRNLFDRLPNLLRYSDNSSLLDARDPKGRLAAFYVVDTEPGPFSTYVIGCHSKVNYVPGASDLLCYEMIDLSLRGHKKYVHLGLGVNPGIRRFKEKWGGKPALSYEMCEITFKRPSIFEIFQRKIG